MRRSVATTRHDAEQGIDAFVAEYDARYPKAADSLTRDQDELLTFFEFPAEHWKSLRTTNVVESSFATVRLRQRNTKGNGSRTKGLTMAYKLLDMAEQRWRRLNGAALLPLVRTGAAFKDGKLIGRPPYFAHEAMRRPISSWLMVLPASASAKPRSIIRANASSRSSSS